MEPLDATMIQAYQSELLNFLSQQAIAHAAIVFATLIAVFTFASAFRTRLEKNDHHHILAYGFFLVVLFWGSVYGVCRLLVYGALVHATLTYGTPSVVLSNSTCIQYLGKSFPTVPVDSFSAYSICVANLANGSSQADVFIWPFISSLGYRSFLFCLWIAVFLTLITFVLAVPAASNQFSAYGLPKGGRLRYLLVLIVSVLLGTAHFNINAPNRDMKFLLVGTVMKMVILGVIAYYSGASVPTSYLYLIFLILLGLGYMVLIRRQDDPGWSLKLIK